MNKEQKTVICTDSLGEKIPKSFQLYATKIDIVYDNKLMNEKSQYGESRYSESKIVMSDTHNLDPLSKDKMLDTFYHEKVHMLLDTMGEHELSNNEKFVDTFGKLLRQSDVTAKYK